VVADLSPLRECGNYSGDNYAAAVTRASFYDAMRMQTQCSAAADNERLP
jgi:hypothetical protein